MPHALFRSTRNISVRPDRARRLRFRCVSAGQRTSLAASLQNHICGRCITHTCLHMWAHGWSFYLAAPQGATCHMRFRVSDVISSIRRLRRSESPAGAKFKVWDQWNLSGGGGQQRLRFQQHSPVPAMCILMMCDWCAEEHSLLSSPSAWSPSSSSFILTQRASPLVRRRPCCATTCLQ